MFSYEYVLKIFKLLGLKIPNNDYLIKLLKITLKNTIDQNKQSLRQKIPKYSLIQSKRVDLKEKDIDFLKDEILKIQFDSYF